MPRVAGEYVSVGTKQIIYMLGSSEFGDLIIKKSESIIFGCHFGVHMVLMNVFHLTGSCLESSFRSSIHGAHWIWRKKIQEVWSEIFKCRQCVSVRMESCWSSYSHTWLHFLRHTGLPMKSGPWHPVGDGHKVDFPSETVLHGKHWTPNWNPKIPFRVRMIIMMIYDIYDDVWCFIRCAMLDDVVGRFLVI